MAGRHYIAVGIVLVGCGGAAPEPAAPESAAPEPEAAAVETVEPEAAPEAAETEPESAAPEPAAPEKQSLSKEELTLVLQQLLDDPDLEQYLHLDKAGRLPLKISGADLPEKLAAHKGGYDVKVVPEPKSAKDAVLVITKIERDGSQVRLRYRFDVEGVRGSALVFEKNGSWRLRSNRVIEK